ncbi:recombinase family protein [Streptomyces sp. NPDC015032]|uniref:recombinase family protein n=1 Tax=Streptomyces sp. NPDC015032 TaxID=3364937 RepID=UPI0036FB3CD9
MDKELTLDEDEAAVIERMRGWQAEGVSIRAIANRLNSEGIPTKRGGRWHATTVNRLLSPDARAAARQQSAHARAAEREQTKRDHADRMLSRLT